MVTLEQFVINKFKIMTLMKTAFFFFCLIASQISCAQSQFNVKFDSEISLRKFVVTKMSKKDSDYFRERPPYSMSATFNITLDMDGNILKMDLLERSEDERFNEVFKDLIMKTSGLWKVTNPKTGVSTVNIIIPVLQKTPPDLKELENPALIKKFQDFHRSLKVGEIPNCKQGSCVILDEIINGILPGSKGIK